MIFRLYTFNFKLVILVKKIALRIIVLIVLLVGMNVIYSKFFYEDDLKKHSLNMFNSIQSIKPESDIIYLGESSNSTYSKHDKDKRTLGEFVSDYYPTLITSSVTKKAAHAGIFKHILSNIPESPKKRTVIVTLNLRSFSASWIYSKLETALQKEVILIQNRPDLLNRALLSFKDYDVLNEKERVKLLFNAWTNQRYHDLPFEFPYKHIKEWDKAKASIGIKGLNGKLSKKKTSLACNYIKRYAFQIDFENNPRIKDFNQIIQLGKERNWNLVFNIVPENLEKADFLVGENITYFMKENVKQLENYFTKKGVLVVNNLSIVEDSEFRDQMLTTEHYAEKGRKSVARSVAIAIKKFHQEKFSETNFKQFVYDYKPIQIDPFYTISKSEGNWEFSNDFEGDKVWGSPKNITSEKAFSGNKSGFALKGSIYGPSLIVNPKLSPQENLLGVIIKGKIFSENLNSHKTKIVIQAKSLENKIWKSFKVKNLIKHEKKWCDFTVTYQLPSWIKESKKVRIYLLNESKEKCYLDDFKVIFY